MNLPRLMFLGLIVCASSLAAALDGKAKTAEVTIGRLELLPDRPSPFVLRDWRKTAIDFDRLVFDLHAAGPFKPLVWRVSNVPNLKVAGFAIPSYVGNEERRGMTGEAIAALGALLGATEVGIDKREWVELAPEYLNAKEGTVLNDVGGQSGHTFWYELLPSIVFTQLASRYPNWTRGRTISNGIAEAWISGIAGLHGDFDHTSYDFMMGKPVDNGHWIEPDAAAGVAYLELSANLREHDDRFLVAAHRALAALERRKTNPTYEVLTGFGALAAAYLNAERGETWDLNRFLNWCFEPTSPYRTGWGMICGRWGDDDVGGLMGSTTDDGGYAFAMNSFINAATLAPIARYDSRYSSSLAKWILNLENASRLFYRDGLPLDHQSSPNWSGDPSASIAYEGLRRSVNGKSPYGTGDATRGGWSKTDFGLYGGAYVGLLGALVHKTNVPMILRIDLRATDFLPTRAYRTELFWNPYETAKSVLVDLGSKPVRAYDAVAHGFLTTKPTRGRMRLRLASKQAVQLVYVSESGRPIQKSNETLVNGIAIDFRSKESQLTK